MTSFPVACLGLINAIDGLDLDRGVAFSSCARVLFGEHGDLALTAGRYSPTGLVLRESEQRLASFVRQPRSLASPRDPPSSRSSRGLCRVV